MDDHVTLSMFTAMNSSTFTGLPDDTQVNITVSGIRTNFDILSVDSTSVTTGDFKSMCKFTSCWLLNKGVHTLCVHTINSAY